MNYLIAYVIHENKRLIVADVTDLETKLILPCGQLYIYKNLWHGKIYLATKAEKVTCEQMSSYESFSLNIKSIRLLIKDVEKLYKPQKIIKQSVSIKKNSKWKEHNKLVKKYKKRSSIHNKKKSKSAYMYRGKHTTYVVTSKK